MLSGGGVLVEFALMARVGTGIRIVESSSGTRGGTRNVGCSSFCPPVFNTTQSRGAKKMRTHEPKVHQSNRPPTGTEHSCWPFMNIQPSVPAVTLRWSDAAYIWYVHGYGTNHDSEIGNATSPLNLGDQEIVP